MAYKFTRKDLALAVGIVVALLWAVFVWPTVWKEYKIGPKNVRVNRFTGATETLDSTSGWYRDKP